METLVTGATGFAGRTLAAALRQAGHPVRALVREGAQSQRGHARERLEDLGVSIVAGDVRDEASLTRAARGVEVVFHCARSEDPARPRKELEALNLVGTENTLAACRAAGVRRMVFLSTADVTRGFDARSYVDEDLAQPASFFDAAAETIGLAEDLVVAASDATLSTVTLRPGWLWGVDDTSFAPRVIRWSRGGWRWIDGGASLCATTNVVNLSAAMLLAATAEAGAGGVYYLTDDERVSVREFLTRLATSLGVTLRGASVPFALAYALAWLRDRSGDGAHHRGDVTAFGRSAHFNIQRARKQLEYAPVIDVAEGMRRVAQWASAVGVEAIAAARCARAP